MTKHNFFSELAIDRISPDLVKFDDNHSDDVFCVNRNYHRYEVFYRERGKIFDLREFSSESDALIYLLAQIRGMHMQDFDGKGAGEGAQEHLHLRLQKKKSPAHNCEK